MRAAKEAKDAKEAPLGRFPPSGRRRGRDWGRAIAVALVATRTRSAARGRRATSFASFASFARAPHRGRVAAGHQLAARLPRSGPSARRFGRSGISAAVSQQRRAEAGQPSCRTSCRATRPSSARRTRKITHTLDRRNTQRKLTQSAYVCIGCRLCENGNAGDCRATCFQAGPPHQQIKAHTGGWCSNI